jgi:hypothetical protein
MMMMIRVVVLVLFVVFLRVSCSSGKRNPFCSVGWPTLQATLRHYVTEKQICVSTNIYKLLILYHRNCPAYK